MIRQWKSPRKDSWHCARKNANTSGSLNNLRGRWVKGPIVSRDGEKGDSYEWHCRAEMSAQIGLGLPERIF